MLAQLTVRPIRYLFWQHQLDTWRSITFGSFMRLPFSHTQSMQTGVPNLQVWRFKQPAQTKGSDSLNTIRFASKGRLLQQSCQTHLAQVVCQQSSKTSQPLTAQHLGGLICWPAKQACLLACLPILQSQTQHGMGTLESDPTQTDLSSSSCLPLGRGWDCLLTHAPICEPRGRLW